MLVLHIITGLHTGGAETVLLRLVDRLRADFPQQVISLTGRGPIADRITALGVPVTALGMSQALPNPATVARLAITVRRLRPALVQTWMYHADLIGGIAARLAGVHAVAWGIRNSDLPAAARRTRLVAALCARLSSRVPQRIVCCAETARRIHVKLGYDAGRFVVIPNGFDLDRFAPDPRARAAVRVELAIPPEAPLIGLVARLDPQKNHALFVEAAGILHQRRPDAHFVLVGQGVRPDHPRLGEWIRQAGIQSNAHLLGERADVPRLMAALDVASLTSAWGEAFPNVLAEAMACGTLCVATDVGDASSIVGDTGTIVPKNDPRALASAWERLLSLPAADRAALGGATRAHIAHNFEMGAVARRYSALYHQMLKERG